MSSVESIRHPKQRCQPDHSLALLRRKRREVAVLLLRLRSPVVAGDVRHYHLLVRRHAEQLGVGDEVVRVLVMALVANVVADIVEQRRVGQRLPVFRGASDARLERIEQLKRKLAHLMGMRQLVMTPVCKLKDRPAARLAR